MTLEQVSGADQRVKTEEQQAIKANSWAAKIKANIKPEVVAKIAEDDRKVAAENAAKLAKKAEEKRIAAIERKAEYDRNYEPNMQRKYGIKQTFVVPSIGYWEDELHLPVGSFWEFMVEGSRNESELAKSRRKNPENSSKFHAYLAEKYGRNWLEVSQGKEDDCPYLWDLREKERSRQEEEEWEREERQREQWKEIEKEMEEKEREREEMDRKLQRGEITRKQFNKWQQEREEEEWEDQENYHIEGLRLYGSMERQAITDAAWVARKALREK